MNRKNIIEKIDEALASKTTSESDKQLLYEIRQELINTDNREEIVSLVLKLLELFGILVGLGSSG